MTFFVDQKQIAIRSQRLLDSARGAECTLRFPGVCNCDWSTTVSAHIRDDIRGLGHKADDCSTVHACFSCHSYLDLGIWRKEMTKEALLETVLRAVLRTQLDRILRGYLQIIGEEASPIQRLPRKRRSRSSRIPTRSFDKTMIRKFNGRVERRNSGDPSDEA